MYVRFLRCLSGNFFAEKRKVRYEEIHIQKYTNPVQNLINGNI